MIYDKHIWYDPSYLLHCGFEAEKQAVAAGIKLPIDIHKAINESRATALWALGVNKLHGTRHLVQMVDPKDDNTPDTRILHPTQRQLKDRLIPWGGYVDVEVVTYGEHSGNPIDEFLHQTKLALTKSYQADTVILCYIDRDVQGGKTWRDIHADLQHTKSKLETFLLGKTHPTRPLYASAMVHPTYGEEVQFDVLEEANLQHGKGVQIINFPADHIKIQLPATGFNPFTTTLDDL